MYVPVQFLQSLRDENEFLYCASFKKNNLISINISHYLLVSNHKTFRENLYIYLICFFLSNHLAILQSWEHFKKLDYK